MNLGTAPITGKNAGINSQFNVLKRGCPFALLLVTALLMAGCSRGGTLPEEPRGKAASAARPGPAEPWAATETNPHCPTPAVLWNGLIGLRLGRDGTAASANPGGWPMFDIDEYDVDGEEKIRPLPNPVRFAFMDGKPLFEASQAREYLQRLDFRTGILTSTWRQTHSKLGEVRLLSEVVLHPQKRVLAQRWTLETKDQPPGHAIKFTFESDGPGPSRIQKDGSRFSIFERSSPSGLRLTFEVGLSLGRSPQAQRIVEARQPGDYDWAADFDKPEPTQSFDEIAAAAERFHSGPDAPDIEIDGPVEDQQAIRSFLFYLRSAVHSKGNMAVAPMGLSSQTYHGHVFWDADIWVFPALALIEPERAAAIPQYRLNQLRPAMESFQEWVEAGRPTAHAKLGHVSEKRLSSGAKFPWESSVTGKETVPGPSRFQDHITGSVAFAARQAGALGLMKLEDSASVTGLAKGFFSDRTVRGDDGRRRLPGTMSPDENHTGDDDLYTNLLAQWCLSGGRFLTSTPLPPSSSGAGEGGNRTAKGQLPSADLKMYLPRDEKSFLTYEGDPERSYKQAAAVLAIYPLQFPEAERQGRVMMERFAPKVTPNGPAMSDSVHALIWARLGEKEKAYETWRKSWQDFTKHPLLLFSEKRSKEVSYFTTGAGGCLQAVLYGFLGIRIGDVAQSGVGWSTPLRNGRTLGVKPNLPNEWRRVVFKNFRFLGKRFTLEADHEAVSVVQASSPPAP